MNTWDWIWHFERAARLEGNAEKLRLTQLLMRGENISHERPDEMFATFEEGRVLAARLGEKWWEMVFEFWKIQTLLYKKQDPRGALKLAAQCVVEMRKPAYEGLPQKAAIGLDLVACYVRLDPLGYRTEIEAALADAKNDSIHEEDARYYAQIETRFLWSIEDERALSCAWNYLRLADEDDSDHHAVFALSYLCGTLYEFDKTAARAMLPALSERGVELARSERRERLESNFLMWVAVAARWNGEEADAQKIALLAQRRNARHTKPRNGISNANRAFHEIKEEWPDVLRVCDTHLQEIDGHDLDFEEANWRLERLKVLQKLGQNLETEAERLLQVAARLRSKPHWEAEAARFTENR